MTILANHYSSAPEWNRQNPPDRTMDLPFFFRYKQITSLKKGPFARTNREFAMLVSGQLCSCCCFELLVERISLSAFANRFELRCEPKELMLLYYKICPCWYPFVFPLVSLSKFLFIYRQQVLGRHLHLDLLRLRPCGLPAEQLNPRMTLHQLLGPAKWRLVYLEKNLSQEKFQAAVQGW